LSNKTNENDKKGNQSIKKVAYISKAFKEPNSEIDLSRLPSIKIILPPDGLEIKTELLILASL